MVAMSQAKMERRALPKRFYKHAAFEAGEGGFCITLDGKRIKTPAKKLLQVRSENVAANIAEEWAAQIEVIDTDAMPLTRLAHIALDLVPQARADLLDDITRYAETDLLCYRAPSEALSPMVGGEVLRARQAAAFDPILAWVRAEFSAAFITTDGLMPVPQNPESIAQIAAAFAAANDDELAALAMLVPLLGSALLALALWKGKLTVEEALVAARLDEDTQAERWGGDAELAAAWAAKCRDIRAGAFFLTANTLKNQ